MAEQDERSQDPTPHRRQKAREEGQVARSTDLVSALILLVGLVAIIWYGGGIVQYFGASAQRQLSSSTLTLDSAGATAQWWNTFAELGPVFLPLLGLLTGVSILGNLMQVGWLMLPEKLMPDLERLDILRSARQMFSGANLIKLFFGVMKIAVVGIVAGVCLYNERDQVLSLSGFAVPQIALFYSESLVWIAIKIAMVLLILAIIDYGYQRWKFERDLRMSPQEIREEMRNQQGDPQIIGRRRAVQRQLVLNRMKSAVPKADVVITNPTELAIAVQYDPTTMAAPIVVAKGAGLLAQRIRQVALEHGIPIIERKPLAQSLYKHVEVNRPIPSDLYSAVAEVLAYVYQLTGKKVPRAEEMAGGVPTRKRAKAGRRG